MAKAMKVRERWCHRAKACQRTACVQKSQIRVCYTVLFAVLHAVTRALASHSTGTVLGVTDAEVVELERADEMLHVDLCKAAYKLPRNREEREDSTSSNATAGFSTQVSHLTAQVKQSAEDPWHPFQILHSFTRAPWSTFFPSASSPLPLELGLASIHQARKQSVKGSSGPGARGAVAVPEKPS